MDISETKETAGAAKEAAETAENNRITETTVEYQEGTSGTSAPTGAWSSAIPAVQEGRYLWTRVTLTFASGSTAVFYSVGKIGARGDDVYSFVIRDGNLIQVKASAADDNVQYGIDDFGYLNVKINF